MSMKLLKTSFQPCIQVKLSAVTVYWSQTNTLIFKNHKTLIIPTQYVLFTFLFSS